MAVNVLEVLTVTTVAFLAFVAVWITKLEDYIEARNSGRYERGDRPEEGSE